MLRSARAEIGAAVSWATDCKRGADVDRLLGSQPILARNPSAVYQLTKMVHRNRLGAAFAATVLLLLVAFAVIASVQARAIARQRDRAEAERLGAAVDAAIAAVGQAQADRPRFTEPQRRLVERFWEYRAFSTP